MRENESEVDEAVHAKCHVSKTFSDSLRRVIKLSLITILQSQLWLKLGHTQQILALGAWFRTPT